MKTRLIWISLLIGLTSLSLAQAPKGKGKGKGRQPTTGPGEQQRPYQDLWIPPLLTGKNIDLSLDKNRKSFWPGASTATYGYDNAAFWGPTVILNQGDAVNLRVKNNLDEVTTVHWHGLHLPAAMDGGPHQPIKPGDSWTSSFVVKNNAATYWYHPHPHEMTQKQMTYGAGGLIIIRDLIESKLALPRTYGVDDIPLVFTSRRFYSNNEFSFEGDDDKYGDYLLANGVLDAQVTLPAQFVRLRILNAEIERGYDLGFSDNRTFYVIGTDGGLLDKPVPITGMKLMVGERVELLVNLSDDKPGTSLELVAYNEGQKFGFPGSEPGRGGVNGSLLNNLNFRMLHINVGPKTSQPITRIPEVLTHNRFWTEAEVNNRRSLAIYKARGGSTFSFDYKPFDMHTTNHVVKLGDVEAWTIDNDRTFGHSFHIHDVQFKIISRSDGPVPAYEQGWKDTLYAPSGSRVTFIAKFEDYASNTDAFMYHCHMANHEDSGLMGQFLVSKDPSALKRNSAGVIEFRQKVEHPLTPSMMSKIERQAATPAPAFAKTDLKGNALSLAALTATKPLVLYFIERECPCARDAAPFMDQLQAACGDNCTVVGVINAGTEVANAWIQTVGNRFPILADPDCSIIRAYGAECAAYTTLVAPGGTIVKTYPGYSAETLKELSAQIARLSRSAERPMKLDNAPQHLVVGCPLGRASITVSN
ncbi:MAG TPA: hypothetical protein DDZ88_07335 [Verrucomicrobiales bacterium]|nr:hypothetical protein [Verrucomicrobiales bacterium]